MQNNSKLYHLFNALKEHSNLSHTGFLELCWGSESLEVIFKEGKIVGCNSDSMINSLSNKLAQDYKINIDNKTNVLNSFVQEKISNTEGILPHEIKNIQIEQESKAIAKIKDYSNGQLHFKSKLLDSKRNYFLNLSPAQLMLDILESGSTVKLEDYEIPEQGISKQDCLKGLSVDEANLETKENQIEQSSKDNNSSISSFIVCLNEHSVQQKLVNLAYLGFASSVILFSMLVVNPMFSELYHLLELLSH